VYDAAGKAFNAVLENEGLRTTSRGGHIAVLDAVSAQLDPHLVRSCALLIGSGGAITRLSTPPLTAPASGRR
jgi:hypothetical protein